MVAAAACAAIAIGMWVAPDGAAQRLGLSVVGAAGRATVRADLGGVFGSMAALCCVAVWTRERAWQTAAALLPALIAMGRVIEWIASGGSNLDRGALAIELILLAVLIVTRTPIREESTRTVRRPASGGP
jgi:hypothetical protein